MGDQKGSVQFIKGVILQRRERTLERANGLEDFEPPTSI